MNKQEILLKINQLIVKWKDNIPPKSSNEWWRYRADQSLYLKLKQQLKKNISAGKTQAELAEEIFNK